jgi:hypothetical protein
MKKTKARRSMNAKEYANGIIRFLDTKTPFEILED